ncbi:MAG: PAS and helix-turn-helix domain-containing protein [Acidobacteria bacterium]|nr:PAS and helix-turn-helix domain-containing protein [Acidobacteriota bacterium]
MKRFPKWLQALGNTADGVFIVDAKQRIIYWNEGAKKLLGFSAPEVIGRHCYEVIAGRGRSGRAHCTKNCSVQSRIQRCVPVQNFELFTATKPGAAILLNVSIVSLPRGNGAFTFHLLRDITRGEMGTSLLERIHRLTANYVGAEQGMEGGLPSRKPAVSLPPGNPFSRLTKRELEVLRLLARGVPAMSIPSQLAISEYTVRNHIRNILTKSGFRSQTQAVACALRKDLL